MFNIVSMRINDLLFVVLLPLAFYIVWVLLFAFPFVLNLSSRLSLRFNQVLYHIPNFHLILFIFVFILLILKCDFSALRFL
jgi:hypothetical protein